MTPVFGQGQLRLYLLAQLSLAPHHGYEMISMIEARFEGRYRPSPGAIYPRLARLEREGMVKRAVDGRRVLYQLTAAGHAELKSRKADVSRLARDLDRIASILATGVRDRSLQREGQRVEGSSLVDSARSTGSGPRKNLDVKPGIEAAMHQLRRDIRPALSDGQLTPETAQELANIVIEAATRVGVLLAGSDGTDHPPP